MLQTGGGVEKGAQLVLTVSDPRGGSLAGRARDSLACRRVAGYRLLDTFLFLESPTMPEYITEAPEPGKWYISESMRITRRDGNSRIEQQLIPRDMRLDGAFSTDKEARQKLPYWQKKKECHEPFIWQYPDHCPQ